MNLAVFDIETAHRVPHFKCGSLVTEEDAYWFDDPGKLIEAMRKLARKGYIFAAHNAEYDASVLMWQHGEDLTIRYVNGLYNCAFWRYGKGKRVAAIWDSYPLAGRLPLRELGRAIGLPKYDMPRKLADPDDIRQDWVCIAHSRAGCIQCYNVRDAEIVYRYITMLTHWLANYDVTIKRSLPSVAVALWQSLDPGMQQSPRSPITRALARRGYYGGRCEAFRYGSVGAVRTYDRRSYYGDLLLRAELPDLGSLILRDDYRSTFLPDIGEGVAECDVWIEPQHVPPLPVTYADRTYYPVGEVSGVWPINELRHAVRHGVEIKRIRKLAYSERVVRPFSLTANVLLTAREDLRRQGDPREVVPKFLINAIPGRLGLREEHEIDTYRRWRAGMTHADTTDAELESAAGALYLVKRHNFRRVSPTSNVLWAACITGAGRTILHKYLREANAGLVYCDTDGVHSQQPLVTGPDRPGELVLKDEWDTSLYLGPKLYRLESFTGREEVRAKGIPERQAREFVLTGRTEYQTSMRAVEAIARGIEPATWIDVERVGRSAPGGRVLLNPTVLRNPQTYSETSPVVFVRSVDGSCVPSDALT